MCTYMYTKHGCDITGFTYNGRSCSQQTFKDCITEELSIHQGKRHISQDHFHPKQEMDINLALQLTTQIFGF